MRPTRSQRRATLCAVALAVAFAPAAHAADSLIDTIVAEISAERIEARIRKLASFGTRHSLSETESETRGIGAARRYIASELSACSRESGGRLEVTLDEFVAEPSRRIPTPTTLVNVVATLPGTQAESRGRVYVVSGHYDSRASDVMNAEIDAPGANDDASGTAASMELACVMARHRFDATLVFLAVAGEEQGLLGATHWAEQASERGISVAAMLTDDIIGSPRAADGRVAADRVRLFAEGVPATRELSDELRVRISTGGENDLPTRQLARFIVAAAERHVPAMTVDMIYRRDRYLRGGDHIPFLERGIPAVRFTEPYEDYRHQHQDLRTEGGIAYGDLPELVDFEYVANVTRVNAAALATLALAPAAPTGVQIEVQQLENDTTLRWDPSPEPDVAGYRVVWRDTTAARWEHSRDVGKVTRHTMTGLSKDDYLFGVTAVDADGNESVASAPVPFRGE